MDFITDLKLQMWFPPYGWIKSYLIRRKIKKLNELTKKQMEFFDNDPKKASSYCIEQATKTVDKLILEGKIKDHEDRDYLIWTVARQSNPFVLNSLLNEKFGAVPSERVDNWEFRYPEFDDKEES